MNLHDAPEMSRIAQGPLDVPLSHVGFCVADLEEAVAFWTTKMHAGPFFMLDDVEFDILEAFGAPAVFDHALAFGQWGDIAVELQQLHRVEPEALRTRLDVPMNHVAYVAEDAEAASAKLEADGMPLYMYCAAGEIACRFHSLPTVAHSVEIHQASTFLADFFSNLRSAAQGWAGEDPLRIGPPPSELHD